MQIAHQSHHFLRCHLCCRDIERAALRMARSVRPSLSLLKHHLALSITSPCLCMVLDTAMLAPLLVVAIYPQSIELGGCIYTALLASVCQNHAQQSLSLHAEPLVSYVFAERDRVKKEGIRLALAAAGTRAHCQKALYV